MMGSCKENRQRVRCENECKLLAQRIDSLEQEVQEQKNYTETLEQQLKACEELQKTTKATLEEQTRLNKESEILCNKYLAKIEDLKKELDEEKKLAEEWETKHLRNNAQSNFPSQVDVSFFLRNRS